LLHSYTLDWERLDRSWLAEINGRCRLPELTLYVDAPDHDQGAGLRACYEAVVDLWPERFGVIERLDGTLPLDNVLLACQVRVNALLREAGLPSPDECEPNGA
jgi:hypothetical protein